MKTDENIMINIYYSFINIDQPSNLGHTTDKANYWEK